MRIGSRLAQGLIRATGLLGAVLLAGCSGGGSGGDSTGVAGIELPAEVSAVSARNNAEGAIRSGKAAQGIASKGLRAQLEKAARAVEDLPAESDYNNVQVRKFVEIKVLAVFDIITVIFDAFRQTHYADPENVGDGWYKCLVAFTDDGEGGSVQKSLQEWYVNSTLVPSGGNTTNRVFVKILEPDDDGARRLIRVQVDITEPPTTNEDGTLVNLGEWQIRAIFGEEEVSSDFFQATATIEDDGSARMTIEESFTESHGEGEEITGSTKAIISRSLDEGYGVVQYPDWQECFGPGGSCDDGPPMLTVEFAYNTNYLSCELDNTEEFSYDRTDEHEIVHRYGLFKATDGSDVAREVNFGFPVRVDEDGDNRFAWYGAWQGHHQLWTRGVSLADGTAVVRNNVPPGQAAPSYTTKSFPGALTRVNLVQGSLDQLEGVAAEIFISNNFRLRWNDAENRWDECRGDNGFGGCSSTEDFTNKLPSLASGGEGDQKLVFINHCEGSEGGFACTNYVYVTQGPSPGFFHAELNPESGRFESTDEALDTEGLPDGFELFGRVNGRAYIQYTADFDGEPTSTGWVEKTLTDFDFQTYTPTFDDEADREFIFEVGRMYFVNQKGAKLRVFRIANNGDAGDYQVFLEVQAVATPSINRSDVYPDGTVLVEPWDPESHSTYVLDTDPDSESYLLLIYNTVAGQDETDGSEVGDVVEKDIWGLRVEGDVSNISDATLYNWEYQSDNEFRGGVTYLLDSEGDYVLLSDPIRFDPIQLASTNERVNAIPEEDWQTYALSFDGSLHGLPDTWWELEKVSFSGDNVPSILSKNVRIPDGTELRDADSDATYYLKAVDVGIFLGQIDAFPLGEEPDLSQTDGINLETDLPEFTAPVIDTEIPDAAVRYIEGVPVE